MEYGEAIIRDRLDSVEMDQSQPVIDDRLIRIQNKEGTRQARNRNRSLSDSSIITSLPPLPSLAFLDLVLGREGS